MVDDRTPDHRTPGDRSGRSSSARGPMDAATGDVHPLRSLLDDAAAGSFPPADGSITVLPPDRVTGLHAVLSFTAHVVVLTDLERATVLGTGIDAYGGATDPSVLLALAGSRHRCGVLDVALVRRGTGPVRHTGHDPEAASRTPEAVGDAVRTAEPNTSPRHPLDDPLVETDRHDDHPRVRYARELRRDVRVFADSTGLVTIGRGLGGRHELGVEMFGDGAGRGRGTALLSKALSLVPADEWLYAACAPGNARSLKALLALGFVPFGSEVLLSPF